MKLDEIRDRVEKLREMSKSFDSIITNHQVVSDLEALLRCFELMKRELECSTNWYLAKCECCRPFGDRARQALAEVEAILSSSHEPGHTPYTEAKDIAEIKGKL